MKKLVYIMILVLMSVNLSGCLLDKYKTVEKVENYGDRLENVEKEEFNHMVISEVIDDKTGVSSYTYNVSGNIIYIKLYIADGYGFNVGEYAARDIVEKCGRGITDYYDINFTLKRENGTKMGAKNVGSDEIVWTREEAE